MSYEFNAGDSFANDYPNPYKVENLFLFASAIALLACGVSVLLVARTHFQAKAMPLAGVTVALALVLFGAAVTFLMQCLQHIRFYMGRKHPRGLAKELNAELGISKEAMDVMNTLRDGAIDFPEPKGPLNGILYTLIKPLITSPPPIQAAAVTQFHGVVAAVGLMASMALSYVFCSGSAYEGIVSWMYLPMSGLSLVTPFMRSEVDASSAAKVDQSDRMLWKLIGLITFAVIGPVAIPHLMPAYPVPPMWIAPALLLTTSTVASMIFLASLFSKIDNVAQTSVSCEQTTISMNCHPAQLWPKVSRDFQSQWVRNTPNRSYANVPPGATESDRGRFQGYILEETQPTAFDVIGGDRAGDSQKSAHVRWLALLNLWATLLSAGAGLVAAWFAPAFSGMARMEISRSVLVVIALTVSAALAFRIGHLLWSRMYFKSRLYWIVVDGTFQDGEMRIGNQFTGNVQSRAKLTRVEDATLRVWVTDIVSVAFGKDAKRFMMAMAPADGVAKALANGLKEFALSQSSVAAPTAIRDMERARGLVEMERAISGADTSALETLQKKVLAHQQA